ncbi:MAG TPA: hypothetical protein VJP86_05855 [Vicinamibacterales bacterium]|nr:hypothetical protein [Vicinamibacterales bacterium]
MRRSIAFALVSALSPLLAADLRAQDAQSPPGLTAGQSRQSSPNTPDTPAACRFVCELEWKFEPTFTIENLANRHRVVTPDGVTEHVNRERVFETVLALDLTTKLPRLGFTAEAIVAPASDDNDVELEFEANFHWLTDDMLNGWLTSHVDVVDQFSPAERPHAAKAYSHKLDFELDTAFHPFNRLPDGKWLKGVELEVSLDYLASGLPKKGDRFADGTLYLDDASPWSISFVFVVPIAPS